MFSLFKIVLPFLIGKAAKGNKMYVHAIFTAFLIATFVLNKSSEASVGGQAVKKSA